VSGTGGPGRPDRGASPLTGTLVTVMAIATGAIVANLYYVQPLLHQITRI
jgi:hypothetical protein